MSLKAAWRNARSMLIAEMLIFIGISIVFIVNLTVFIKLPSGKGFAWLLVYAGILTVVIKSLKGILSITAPEESFAQLEKIKEELLKQNEN